MKSPITGKPMTHKSENIFLSELELSVDYQYWLCEDSGNKFVSEEDSEVNHNNLMAKMKESEEEMFNQLFQTFNT